jgi:hypothetical protein
VICPNCGLSIIKDETVTRDGFTVDPRGAVTYRGRALPITGAQRIILHSLASSITDVRNDALTARIGADECYANNIARGVCGIRQKLRKAGAPDVITNARGAYRWLAPQQQ